MTATNRVRLTVVKETTLGTTPVTPRMRTKRFVSDSLKGTPTYLDSDEIRSDRMNDDPILSMRNSGGGVNGELSFPDQDGPLSIDIESAMFSTWSLMPTRDNDGTADSVITDVGILIVAVTTGATFALGHLVSFTGFTNAANNGVKRVTVASATVPQFTGGGLVVETVPPGTARMKVVGFAGVAGDITATASGLGSTTLNFTNMGLQVGQWINIGGTAVGDLFATAANNGYARIIAIAATALTLDNLPTGWGVDAGTGKTIKVWTGDFIKNGVTTISQTIEKGFMAQPVPSYVALRGQVVDTMEVNFSRGAKITLNRTYKGMSVTQSTVSVDAVPDVQSTGKVMAAHAHVGRISENGSQITSPNWMSEFSLTINNNLRYIESLDAAFPVSIEAGECTVTGNANTYFGNLDVLSKFTNGTPSSLNARSSRDGQSVIWDVPRATYREGGDISVSGKNANVMLNVGFQASIDTLTQAHVSCTRMEYVEPPTSV